MEAWGGLGRRGVGRLRRRLSAIGGRRRRQSGLDWARAGLATEAGLLAICPRPVPLTPNFLEGGLGMAAARRTSTSGALPILLAALRSTSGDLRPLRRWFLALNSRLCGLLTGLSV